LKIQDVISYAVCGLTKEIAVVPLLIQRILVNRVRWRFALHESGHAVADWHSPAVLTVKRLSLNPPLPGLAGYVSVTYRGETGSNVLPWERAVVKLAGLVAELKLGGKARSGEGWSDLTSALETAEAIVAVGAANNCPWTEAELANCNRVDWQRYFRKGLGENVRSVLDVAYRRTVFIVSSHAEEIRAVARLALRNGDLVTADFERLLGPKKT
jgi:ATP-dependent Zn protease